MSNNPADIYEPGDVFQINEKHSRQGWIGAFVMASEIKSFGIQGFVHLVLEHEKHGRQFIRLKWDEIEYIGVAALIPANIGDDDD